MESLDKIQNGDYTHLRKNDASRFVANDILRQGNNMRAYDNLKVPTKQAFPKIDIDDQDRLQQDAMRIQKLKMNLNNMQDLRMETPDLVK